MIKPTQPLSTEKKRETASFLQRLLDKIYPHHCILCSSDSTHLDLCEGCQANLPRNQNACLRCAHPLETSHIQTRLICAHCLKSPLVIDHSIVPFLYQNPISFMVKQLKFHNQLAYAPLIAHLISQALQQEENLPQLIIPVPLHSKRLQQRGFNQSQQIAEHIAKQLNLNCRYDLVTRHKNTTSQTELNTALRQQNIKGAFRVIKPIGAKRVAIVDDVMTSGATANELAITLKQAGIEEVQLWAFARAGQH